MIPHRIQLIQSMIEATHKTPGQTKSKLLRQVAALKSKIETLADSHPNEAASITHFAGAAAHEAARSSRNPRLAETAWEGLGLSVQGLEDSHPFLFGAVSRFVTALSNLGL